MGRKLSCLFLMTILIFSLSLPALAAPEDADAVTGDASSVQEETVQSYQNAADLQYSGPLDALTGLPATKTQVGDDPAYVILREGSFGYDKDLRCFVNEVESQSFTSNIPSGAILSAGRQTVSFTVPGGLVATLYHNGELVSGADLTNISESGAYILEVAAGNSYNTVSFPFRLVAEKTNAVTEFALPDGFTFESVMLDGDILTPDYQNYTQLMENGAYEITWSNTEIGHRYTTSFALDTEPPVLELPEVVNGEAHSEVTLADLEPNAYIVLKETKTGETETIVSSSAKIEDAGTYHLTVYDDAGNATEYDFTIHVYLNFSAVAAIILVLAGLLGLRLYSRYIRKHPRVG